MGVVRYLSIHKAEGHELPEPEEIVEMLNAAVAKFFGAPQNAEVLYENLSDALTTPEEDEMTHVTEMYSKLDRETPEQVVFEVIIDYPKEDI